MTNAQINTVLAEFIPEWAIRKSDGRLELGAQLCTRDGRRSGNGFIIGIEDSEYLRGISVYVILTDAGNEFRLIANELFDMFYPPQWVADWTEVIIRFRR